MVTRATTRLGKRRHSHGAACRDGRRRKERLVYWFSSEHVEEAQAETTAEPVKMSGKHSTDRSLAEQGATSELGVRNTPREKGYHKAQDSMSNNREPARTVPGIK
jgi:hypothetical protein